MKKTTSIITCVLLILLTQLNAAQFTVSNLDDSGPGSLRQALVDAAANTEADTINITVSGTISLTTQAAAGFNILPTTDGVTINGNGVTLDNNTGEIGRFIQLSNATVNDLTFNGGLGVASAGALFLTGDNQFNNCTFSNNTMSQSASSGGAIRVRTGTTTLTSCTFTDNNAWRGAAIWVQGEAVCNLINSTISGSVVNPQDPRSELESAVAVEGGTINMTNSSISGTTPSDVADIYVSEDGLGTIDDSSDFGTCAGPGCPNDEPACEAEGGTLTVEGTTVSEATICTGDNQTDLIVGELIGNTGSRIFFTADADGVIRGFLGSNNSFNFENFGTDVIYVYNFSQVGDVTGLQIGSNIADVTGCISFSNPLIITTQRVGTTCDDGDACTIGDTVDSDCNCTGTLTDSDGDGVCDTDDICEGFDDNIDTDGDGTPDGCDTPQFNNGDDIVDCSASTIGVVTLTKSCVIVNGEFCWDATRVQSNGDEFTNVYIWNATAAEWSLNGITPCTSFSVSTLPAGGTAATLTPADFLDQVVFGGNVCSIIQAGNIDCSAVVGGDLALSGDGSLERTICAGDGQSDAFSTTISNATGSRSVYVVTTTSGDIIETSETNSFDFEGAGAGICLV